MSKRLLTVALSIAVASTLIFIPLTAGSQEGRSDSAQPGPATAPAEGGTVDNFDGWDGDGPAPRDQVILDDLIVDGSTCIGFDCVNGESFGFDTLRLKENNIRIKAQDTSTSASFPSADWQITFNDTTNGGQNKFSIDNITDPGGQTPFTIEAGANSHALYVDDAERIGLSTNNPVVELHIVDGDTPTIRLEQDGSSGFTAQTFDIAGNEANFFVRDVTNGSKLSFKIKPNAPTSSIFVEGTTGDVGLQTEAPDSSLHIRRTNGAASLKIEEASATSAARTLFSIINNGAPRMTFDNTSTGQQWTITGGASTEHFQYSVTGVAGPQFEILNANAIRIPELATAPAAVSGGGDTGALYVDNDGVANNANTTLCLWTGNAWVNLRAVGNCT